jgi:hypothetical protein
MGNMRVDLRRVADNFPRPIVLIKGLLNQNRRDWYSQDILNRRLDWPIREHNPDLILDKATII